MFCYTVCANVTEQMIDETLKLCPDGESGATVTTTAESQGTCTCGNFK